MEEEKYYIEFLNMDKNFMPDRKFFNSYEEAEEWGKDTLEKFHPDMIKPYN